MIAKRQRSIEQGVLIFLSIVTLFPIVGLALQVATADGGDILGTISRVWKVGDFGTALVNSTIVALLTTGFTVAISVSAGYAPGSIRVPGSTLVVYLFIFGLIMPLAADTWFRSGASWRR